MSLTLSQCEQLFTPPAPATIKCEEYMFGGKFHAHYVNDTTVKFHCVYNHYYVSGDLFSHCNNGTWTNPEGVICEVLFFMSKKRLAPLITICTLIPSLLMLFVDFVAFRLRKERMRAEQKRLHIAPNCDLDIDVNQLKKRQRLPSLRVKSTFENLDPHHIRPDFSRTSSTSDLAIVPNHPYEDILSTSSGKTQSSIYPAAPLMRSKSSRVDSIIPLKGKGIDNKRALSTLHESESSFRH